jgi:phosphoglycolate phosphatase-like HAD superfamily hydrolase
MVGDTPADILAARANALPIIALATGIYSVDQLSQHSPDLCLPCCDEILR